MTFDVDQLPDDPEALDVFVREYEEGITGLRKNAQATIQWADPDKKRKTEYALVYLHGFKASYGEGYPVHRNIAKKFGWNLYLSRLYKHGLEDPDAFLNIHANHFRDSALQALAIGRKLGKKVVIMGTSTGGSLGLYLAGRVSSCRSIAALVLYSPLIRFYGFKHCLLASKPGRMALRLVPGEHYILTTPSASPEEEEIWYSSYHLQGALALGQFVQETMHRDTFMKVECPVFAGYYYRDPADQDKVVSVSAIKKMFRQLGTVRNKKEISGFPDAQTHVISSGLLSGCIDELEGRTSEFLQKVLRPNSL